MKGGLGIGPVWSVRVVTACLAVIGASGLVLADVDVFVLREREGALAIEKFRVHEGADVTWKLGEDGFIDVILPPGPGGSAGIVQASGAPETTAACRGDVLSVVTTAAGRRFERPVPARDELEKLDIHVSARSQDGATLGAFIRGYERIEADPVGVIEDPFGNAVPLRPGDCVIYTSTFEARRPGGARVEGEAPVRFEKGHHLAGAAIESGGSGDMVVDLAAGTTVIAKSALPAGVSIEPAVTAQYSAEGVKRLAAELGGATGAAAPLGVARLPALKIGEIVYRDVDVMVMNELPPVAPGVIGILGLDLLSRSNVISLPYSQPGEKVRLRLGEPSGAPPAASLPLAMLGSRGYCRARVDGVDVCMIVDTGSPATIIEERAGAKLQRAEGTAVEARGIGSAKAALRPAIVKTLELGGIELDEAPVKVGDLAIFARFKGPTPIGILGNATLSRFSRVELDFDRGEMRLYR